MGQKKDDAGTRRHGDAVRRVERFLSVVCGPLSVAKKA